MKITLPTDHYNFKPLYHGVEIVRALPDHQATAVSNSGLAWGWLSNSEPVALEINGIPLQVVIATRKGDTSLVRADIKGELVRLWAYRHQGSLLSKNVADLDFAGEIHGPFSDTDQLPGVYQKLVETMLLGLEETARLCAEAYEESLRSDQETQAARRAELLTNAQEITKSK